MSLWCLTCSDLWTCCWLFMGTFVFVMYIIKHFFCSLFKLFFNASPAVCLFFSDWTVSWVSAALWWPQRAAAALQTPAGAQVTTLNLPYNPAAQYSDYFLTAGHHGWGSITTCASSVVQKFSSTLSWLKLTWTDMTCLSCSKMFSCPFWASIQHLQDSHWLLHVDWVKTLRGSLF